MGKDTQDQSFIRNQNAIWREEHTSTHHALPMLICKKWLCTHFDLVYPNGRVNTKALYSKVLTPAVIRGMGMSVAEMRSQSLKTFDRQQTVLLIKLLHL